MSREPLMSVEQFLAGDYLQRADVVLCASKKGLFSKAIRFGTKSPFSHAAAVFVTPKRDLGFNNTFLIESGTSGVDITDLRHYLVDKVDSYQVGIKRLEQPWFQAGEEGKDLQKLVRGQMLDFIKADYDYATIWRIAKQILRQMIFGFQVLRGKTAKGLIAADAAPNRFICSGLVQYGFYAALCRSLLKPGEEQPAEAPSRTDQVSLTRSEDLAAKRDLLEAARQARQTGKAGRPTESEYPAWQAMAEAMEAAEVDRLDAVDFAGAGREEDPLTALLATTPEDLAASEKLAWKYVVSKGRVYQVGGYDEAAAIIRVN